MADRDALGSHGVVIFVPGDGPDGVTDPGHRVVELGACRGGGERISRRRLKLAKADEVLEITGYPVGTVPPFGHNLPIPTIIEANVVEQKELYAGGGEINALIRLKTAELQRVLQAPILPLAQ
jgi:hypothetical protein